MVFFLLVLLACALVPMSALEIKTSQRIIYSRSPKLRINGTGFEGLDPQEMLMSIMVLPTEDHPEIQNLMTGKDYSITRGTGEDKSALVLKLLAGKMWADLSNRIFPVTLTLTGVYANNAPDSANLLNSNLPNSGAKVIARVIRTPQVVAQTPPKIIYRGSTPSIVINGTGLMGAPSVNLYFDPPLFVQMSFDIVSPLPLPRERIIIKLRPDSTWRKEPGILYLKGIDTGGGPLRLGESADGIPLVNVQNEGDFGMTRAKVDDTADKQKIYHDDPSLNIFGSGFNTDGVMLKWSNGIKGPQQIQLNGLAGPANYTISIIKPDSIKLDLNILDKMMWRRNDGSLPGFLTLLAVDNGHGFSPVGPMNTGKGRDIATVFRRPVINSPPYKLPIMRSHSHYLRVNGQGFVPSKSDLGRMELMFEPAILEDSYFIQCFNRTELFIYLVDGKSWAAAPYTGPLKIKAVNSRGDKTGWVTQGPEGEGIEIAQIVDDQSSESSGGVEVFPQAVQIYQSANSMQIPVNGNGFGAGVEFTLMGELENGDLSEALELKQNVDFSVAVVSPHNVVFSLLAGHKWAKKIPDTEFPMDLYVTKVTVGGSSFQLQGGYGIRIAMVFVDPSIEVCAESNHVHETQSKLLTVFGSGFSFPSAMKVTLRPTVAENFEIFTAVPAMKEGRKDTMKIKLRNGKGWLPSFMSIKDDQTKIPLQIVSVDSGAGRVDLTPPVTISYVVRDRPGIVCDDSCEYAFDGVCDEGVGGRGNDDEIDDDEYGDAYYESYYQDDYNGQGDMRRRLSTSSSIKSLFGGRASGKTSASKSMASPRVAATMEEDDYQDFDGEQYYAYNDDKNVGACLPGTDCTDCGGVDAMAEDDDVFGSYGGWNDKTHAAAGSNAKCTNTCYLARNGICDDSRGAGFCALGTDCQDCGPVGASNFTSIMESNDDEFFDDDDQWDFDDDTFLAQSRGAHANRARLNADEGMQGVFIGVLEGIIYTIGMAFILVACYLGYKLYRGDVSGVYQALSLELTDAELEAAPSRKMAITPDVVRS